MADWKKSNDSDVLVSKEVNDVLFLAFPALDQTGLVKHGFSTRLGGVSEGKFATMNFTFTRGDNKEHVMENYHRMAEALDVDVHKMVLSWQTHTTNILKVTKEDEGKGIFRERDYQDVDGLITNVPGITLVTFFADCVPLYILDPVQKAIGLSHSGWRGTVKLMGQKTIDALNREYGSCAKDLIVCIGPSICQECYEVGTEVADAFCQSFDRKYWKDILMEKPDGKYQLNLWQANKIIFLEAGVKPEHIHVTNICTHCNSDYLFSHRRMGNERGNLSAFLSLA